MSSTPPVTPTTPTNILTKIDDLAADVKTLLAKDKGYIEKYWPIAAGIVIALTRFL
jgi:hypothetical protein